MSGHSKWSSIKHKKGAADAKRGRIFTKIIREISVAARAGGGDPDGNPRLRTAIETAKAENMPKDNIERAIKKGTGELEGVHYEESVLEGYGPNGVAILVDIMTDNKNRTMAELRHAFTKYNGNIGSTGCVAWMFDKKGLISFDKEKVDEDKLMEVALDAGADDINDEGSTLEIITDPNDFEAVKEALDKNGLQYVFAKISMIPQNTVKLNKKEAEQVLKLMETLEDSDDVQNVYANFDIPDDIMENITS
ncbi:MAG: YebC/PmpR family DNA-binding transcriptional regulator [Deltaproteobacteria bacterium]|jgi:YebC/PmpR family DNA-binding regulatory protein|nr:YebC/PmpR family DNA-binding transcriptional regulator [Pseudomonadota bacterium]MBW2553823.1 YebC/PmpR family DNA-binding transcriptional regulator [Deltaproteobacteria bacterium]MBW2652204.1 YebC/PmpR family DNA-binding transcriptional regulator [Deltaproteobacteria bacterium]NOQ86773.1 YebC/PmpR family DNA-binding transcriptional regulator [Deltaproteobacteria bacterium]